jgi:hypothetical protein
MVSKPILIASSAVLTLCVAACGPLPPMPGAAAVTPSRHESASSTCYALYTISYPGVVNRPLGECAGTLTSQHAPTIALRKGTRLTVRAVPDYIGEKRVKAPDVTTAKPILAVVRRDNTRGMIVFRTRSLGRDVLVAHTPFCNSPTRGSVSHCVLVHVRVKQ